MGDENEQGYTLIADVAVFSDDKVLFVKYANADDYDGQDGWFLPDSSIKYLEHPDKAAERILADQLGVKNVPPELDHIESFRGNNGSWHLSFHYKVSFSAPNVSPASQIGKAEWFPLSGLPPKDEVAHHGWGLSTLKKILHPKEN